MTILSGVHSADSSGPGKVGENASECQDSIAEVQLSNRVDEWKWLGEDVGTFSVKSIMLDIDRGGGTGIKFKWYKWVTLKCNIMAWRANLDRLATRVNSRRRNMSIPSVMWLMCEEGEETAEHLFTACIFSNCVWLSFSSWCNIPHIFVFSVKDIMEMHGYIQIGRKAKKIIHGLAMITVWCIWKEKNETMFQNKEM
ncbi:uncharacterized protein LOC110888579 [Helianthus annuus]|uniref:uncharacterized protein LOC110888579 n=1 Tax=Helianthus annuus TaxID=4232 RepID=UPI000B8F2CF1|nr:uncharacterized protein LOC110888579 [Helianthus annuus]